MAFKNKMVLLAEHQQGIVAIDKIKNFTGCSVAPFFVLEKEFGEILEKVIKKSR